ncbi:MAG TPA: A24 family peptidase [Pseudonocardiaceae bacterium]|nr:A24 family peptidase [Pseudonocardiaceae bacterium]
MSALSIAGWGLVGLILGAALHLIATKTSLLHAPTERLAPPAVLEIATGALFAALAWRFGEAPSLLAYSWLAAIGVLLSAIDWKTKQLPSSLIWPGGVVLVALFGLSAAVDHAPWPLIRAILGGLAALTFYVVLYILRPGQFGGGDVRLGSLLGIAVGWLSWSALITATLVGWLAAAVSMLVIRALRRPPPNSSLPLGPFLVFGALLTIGLLPT